MVVGVVARRPAALAAADQARLLEEVVWPLLLARTGRPPSAVAAGWHAEFPGASAALRCALDLQNQVARWTAARPASAAAALRVVLQPAATPCADPAASDALAAALLAATAPGAIAWPAAVQAVLDPTLLARAVDLGEFAIDGLAGPIRLHGVPPLAIEPPPDAVLACTGFDDRYHGGPAAAFAQRLAEAAQALSGRPFRVALAADGSGIRWLDGAGQPPPFYLPLLTPSFLEDARCRAELELALDREAAVGPDERVLPIHFVACPALDAAADPLAVRLRPRLRHDWRSFRHLRPSVRRASRAIEALARDLCAARRGPDAAAVVEAVAAALARARSEAGAARADPVAAMPPGSVFRDRDVRWCPEMVVLPPGEFWMGAAADDPLASPEEQPRHLVRIAYPLAVGRFPVTFEEHDHFARVSGTPLAADEGWGRGRRPVIKVSWHDAKRYLAWLSEQTGHSYRLLHDAEWEYACRAGTAGAFWWGEVPATRHANYDFAFGATSLVGSYAPNPFGLYDMVGNVWEWVEDCCTDSHDGAPADGSARATGDGSRRVIRGGSWNNRAKVLRSAFRGRDYPDNRNNAIGFRVARRL
jgi:formylglycine-generating enzyme required for sulfatase activity